MDPNIILAAWITGWLAFIGSLVTAILNYFANRKTRESLMIEINNVVAQINNISIQQQIIVNSPQAKLSFEDLPACNKQIKINPIPGVLKWK